MSSNECVFHKGVYYWSLCETVSSDRLREGTKEKVATEIRGLGVKR